MATVVRRLVLACTLATVLAGCGAEEPLKGVPPGEALRRLLEGNQRYVSARASHPNQGAECRMRIAGGQSPFAAVLGCSDSRVPPEVLFDQGLGDPFVVRSAGQVIDDAGLGSLEYAADHLGVRLIVVLGHERCGAVDAAVNHAVVEGHVEHLVEAIGPAVSATKARPGDPVDNAVRENVLLEVRQLLRSKPVLAELAEEGKVKIVGARYDLDTGRVEVLGP